MSRPKMLDLYCCQGAASEGYRRAGFDVYGSDIDPQQRYPFPFHQGNALDVLRRLVSGGRVLFPATPDQRGRTVTGGGWLALDDFVAIHTSPPCQAFTNAQKIQGNEHPELIEPTRALLVETGLPYVIENVPGAPVRADIELCGATFGLHTYRHRLFESNVPLVQPAHQAPHRPHGEDGPRGRRG
jgi:DNA (cytosine-5)-methyltransferase 1